MIDAFPLVLSYIRLVEADQQEFSGSLDLEGVMIVGGKQHQVARIVRNAVPVDPELTCACDDIRQLEEGQLAVCDCGLAFVYLLMYHLDRSVQSFSCHSVKLPFCH